MLIALALTSLSVLRAHYHDFGRAHYDVLREKDKELLLMPAGGDVQRPVTLDFFDAAFAGFAVDVVYGDSVFILKH